MYSAATLPFLDGVCMNLETFKAVLDQIAEELMGWSREHQSDDNYTGVDPKDILLYILKSGSADPRIALGGNKANAALPSIFQRSYGEQLREADKEPLKAEVIDRHEIVWGKVLESFGKTVAIGLVIIGIVGAAPVAQAIGSLGRIEPHDRPFRQHRYDAPYAQLSGFLYHHIHALAPRDSLCQRHAQR